MQMDDKGKPTQILSLRRVINSVSPDASIPAPSGLDLVKQVDYVLAAVPSLLAFLAFNHVVKSTMRQVLPNLKFPAPLVGMFLFFFAMLSMPRSAAAKFVEFFEPGVTLLTNFLPALFAPGLIRTPAALKAGGVSMVDFLKFCLAISLGGTAIAIETGIVTESILRLTRKTTLSPTETGMFTELIMRLTESFSLSSSTAPPAKATVNPQASKVPIWCCIHIPIRDCKDSQKGSLF